MSDMATDIVRTETRSSLISDIKLIDEQLITQIRSLN